MVTPKAETRAAAAWVLDEILKLLHPFMPFVTEELWRVTAEQGNVKRRHMLALDTWPQHEVSTSEAEAEIGWVIDLDQRYSLGAHRNEHSGCDADAIGSGWRLL